MKNDRYLTSNEKALPLARELFAQMNKWPIISPHGHVAAELILENKQFSNPVELLIKPDHYLTRMLFSQGISFETLDLPIQSAVVKGISPQEIWRIFAENWKLFRGTPSRIWFQEILSKFFEIDEILNEVNADAIYEKISIVLAQPEFRPQHLLNQFNIEVLATTDSTSSDLQAHRKLLELDLNTRIIPTFRPDDVSDPLRKDWRQSIKDLSTITGVEIATFKNLLSALRLQRNRFSELGGTATDHGVLSANCISASDFEKERLFKELLSGNSISPSAAANFSAIMLFEHAKMSAEDGLVMQIHPGAVRNFDQDIFNTYGADRGFDIPLAITFTKELQPVLNAFGKSRDFRLVLFTLDESTYSRELAPIAGVYPSVRIGPPWWFLDSLNGMRRWRDLVTETAGFYNTVGFIDDTRAFCSIPVRHDLARRFDSGYLAEQVIHKRITEFEAYELADQISYHLSKNFYRL